MKEIVFNPWVVEKYSQSKKIMVLGEIHYGYLKEDGNFTPFIIKYFIIIFKNL